MLYLFIYLFPACILFINKRILNLKKKERKRKRKKKGLAVMEITIHWLTCLVDG